MYHSKPGLIEHVVEGVVERAQERIDLRHQVAWEEAESLACFHRWARG